MQRPASREVPAPSLSTPRLVALAALIGAASASVVLGAEWITLSTVPHGGGDTAARWLWVALIPVVGLGALWMPWLAAALTARRHRALLVALAAAPTAGLAVLIAVEPAVFAPSHWNAPELERGVAVFATGAFTVALAVLATARRGRWSALRESVPLLALAVAGVPAAVEVEGGHRLAIAIAVVAPLGLLYLLSPLWLLALLTIRSRVSAAPTVVAGVAGVVALGPLASMAGLGAPIAECALVTVVFVVAYRITGRRRRAAA
jgi:hypothetical protein